MCLLCVGALFVACGSKSRKTAEVAGQADRYMSLVMIRISMAALHLPDILGVRLRKMYPSVGKKESV